MDCFAEGHRLIRAPGELEMRVCGRCGAYFLGNRWRELGGDETLAGKIGEEVLLNLRVTQVTEFGPRSVKTEEARGLGLRVEPRIEGKKALVKIRVRGKLHERQLKPVEEGLEVEVQLKSTTCDVCRLKSAGHYEGILQVRGKPLRGRIAEVKGLLKRCEAEMRERDRTAFIARIEEGAGGLDLYVNPLALARRMARVLKEELGAKLSESAKLVGEERGGRRKFRVSILAKLPE